MKYAMAAHHCKSKVNDSARCEQKPNSFECFAEPTPIFCKDSANRAQYKMKGPRLSFLLPRCSLSYSKIVQGERSAKRKTRFLICTSEPQPILGLKHQTLPLMGATRLASGKMLLLFSRVSISILSLSPARRGC